MSAVRDEPARDRFVLDVDGAEAIAVYRRDAEGRRVFVHTEVPPALRGRGIATRLIDGAVALLRRDGETAIAQCPFVVAYAAEHPDSRDVIVG